MKEINENIKKVFESKKILKAIVVIGILIATSLVFQAGVFVGFHKASFGRNWGDNYERNFGIKRDNHGGFREEMGLTDNFPNASGAVGKIIKIELPTIIVQDKDGTEKVILTKDDTTIRSMKKDITKNDLKVNDFIVVIGSPNTEGQIEAKLIRFIPNPPETTNLKTNQ